MEQARPIRFRFGTFEVDVASEQVFEHGQAVPLQSKPFQFLVTLLQHPGAIVTREQISHVLWPDIYVQVNQGLNAAVRKTRIALKDECSSPKYIETLGSDGYRFICPVEVLAWSDSVPDDFGRLNWVSVLPFRATGDARPEWELGIAAEISSLLGRVHPRLRVLAPGSVRNFSETTPSRQLKEQLGARYVVSGAVECRKEKVSIRVRLVDIEGPSLICEGSAEAAGLTEVLNEVVGILARGMQPSVLAAPLGWRDAELGQIRTSKARGYFAAQALSYRQRASDLRPALEAYLHAAKESPEFAPVHAAVANAWIMLAAHDLVAPRPAYQAALAASEKALQICPDLPAGLVAQAWAKLALDHDWAAATRMFEHALRLDPSNALGYAGYGHLLLARGRVDDAVSAMEQGYRLDPLSSTMGVNVATACYYARRFDEAIRVAREILERDSSNCPALAILGASYLAQRRYGDAVEQFETAVQHANGEVHSMEAHLAHAYARAGKTDSAEPILNRLESGATQAPKPAYQIALARLVLGDVNGAVRWLERAFQERYQKTLFLGLDPQLDILRGTKHFDEMCRQVREPVLRNTNYSGRRDRDGAA